MMYTESEILDFVRDEDVKFIRLAFFTLNGKQKNTSIMANQLTLAFKNGVSFDASSIPGFQGPNHSDLFLHPDPSTIEVLPWRPTTGKVVRMFCDIRYPDGTPYEKDCRYILKNIVKKAKEEFGVEFKIGTEIEFYLMKLTENGEPSKIPMDNGGYMDIAPEDKGENIRRELCFTLEQMGIIPEASHHEAGPGQNEIDFKYASPLTSADNTATFKWAVCTNAAINGLYADFSPKPFSDKPGSGMHINISCCHEKDGDTTEYMRYTLAGILKHIEEITIFLNPTANSYNRLGKYKAPKYISYDYENRSQLIRIPATKEEKRIELRSPDPELNPYIAFTLLIAAALDGIKNKLTPPDAVSENLLDAECPTTKNLKTLPSSFEEACSIAEKSEFVKKVLGENLLKSFLESK
ncbi:MAG: glutamine synthetase [Treponema sp.]|nr:glutamine synthetase [Treponema sp.]MBD5412841.1 glutamine synthetase [Treponema sp.]